MLRKIFLENDRSLVAAYSRGRADLRDWLVFLPESGAEFHRGSRAELKGLLGARIASKFNYLVINKPGVGPTGIDPIAFEKSFRRRTRIRDYLTAMKTVIPAHDRIFLVGYSEGAYLAPQVARGDTRVRSIAMIGGGTRGWLKEELSNAEGKARAEIRRQVNAILRRPRSTEKWNGFSFATWNSYRADDTLRALRSLNVPTVAILGARDKTIDFKATLADLNHLAKRKPLQIGVLPRCGHSFSGHWDEVGRSLEEFLILT